LIVKRATTSPPDDREIGLTTAAGSSQAGTDTRQTR
jgi:hypothetical protein